MFRPAALDQIAAFICGDPPLPFPYRSSSKLTAFFTGLDLDFIHTGESRNKWVRDCLTDLSRQVGQVGGYESAEKALFAVVEEVMNPTYFENASDADLDAAKLAMNKVLAPYRLEIVFDERTWTCELSSVDGKFISTAHRSPSKITKITYSPRVVDVPEGREVEKGLVAVMMPFQGFDPVFKAIHAACSKQSLRLVRADDIWDNDSILQDIFDLIYTAEIVISDFTGKNPNVMYETGIAHTLGKHTIPITQNLEHVPSNLQGHRALFYVGANNEGLVALQTDLEKRLQTIIAGPMLGRSPE